MPARVLVLGGSFAGMTAALSVRSRLGREAEVTVVADRDLFVFNPSLIWLPFGKLFHVFQRPAQLGVGFYKDAGRRGEQARCRRCDAPFAPISMVRDLAVVERELGFRYELPRGGHYQDVCPRCRRALFGLAQGALWREYLNDRPSESR